MAAGTRILIVSYHFYPSAEMGARRVSELALMLDSLGVDVTGLSGRPQAVDSPLGERIRDISLQQIWTPQPILDRILTMCRRRDKGPSAVRENESGMTQLRPRSPSFLTRHYRAAEELMDRRKLWGFFAYSCGVLHRLRTQYDVVISSGPPMVAHVAACEIARVHKANWIMDMRDPWAWALPGLDSHVPSWARTAERAAERRCIEAADRVMCASPGIRDLLHQRYPKLVSKFEVVMNGYDWSSDAPPVMGRLSLLYAGTLYLHRDPFPFLDALAEFVGQAGVERSRIAFTLVGHCRKWRGVDVQGFVDKRGLGDVVTIRPPVGSAEMRQLIESSQVLVNFAQAQPYAIPGKTFEAIGAGRYLLTITEEDSSTAQLIKQAGIGRIIPPGDKAPIVDVLRELYDAYVVRGVDLCPDRRHLARYSRAAANRRFLDIVLQRSSASVSSARPRDKGGECLRVGGPEDRANLDSASRPSI